MDRNILKGCPEGTAVAMSGPADRAMHGKSRAAAIKIKCLECCGWNRAEVRRCEIYDCALWGYGGQKK